jgi:hypothetical protein
VTDVGDAHGAQRSGFRAIPGSRLCYKHPVKARTDGTPAHGALLKALHGSGMQLQPGADGTLQARVERLELRNVALQGAAGLVDVRKLTLVHAALDLDTTFHPLALAAEEVHVEHAEVTLARQLPSSGAVRLEPLGTIQGRMRVAIRNAAWVLDVDITMPVVAGRIDFDRVVVEHVGPNSTMGVARDGIYMEAPHRDRTEIIGFASRDIAGVNYEQRGGFIGLRVTDRGSIDLRPFVEALLGATVPLWRPPERDVRTMLDRTRLEGELQLADGVLGTGQGHLVLADRAQGKNGIALTAAVLGNRLVVHWPHLSASSAAFDAGGRSGRTGPIAAALDAHLTGLSGVAAEATVKIHHLAARNVSIRQGTPIAGTGS